MCPLAEKGSIGICSPMATSAPAGTKSKEMNRSELLQARIIDAHENLWERIIAIRHNIPSPYNGVLGLFILLSPSELAAEKKKPKRQFSTHDETFRTFVEASTLDLRIRPYIDDTLWDMAVGRIAFSMRLLLLFSTDIPNPIELTNWPEDELIRQHLQTAFTEQEIERFNYSQPGTYKEITDLWEDRIITEVKKALFN